MCHKREKLYWLYQGQLPGYTNELLFTAPWLYTVSKANALFYRSAFILATDRRVVLYDYLQGGYFLFWVCTRG